MSPVARRFAIAILLVVATASVARGDAVGYLPDVTVRFGTPVVTGPLPPSVIQREAMRHLAEVRNCYERGLRENPGVAGQMVLHAVIAVGTGSVTSATVASTTIRVHIFGDCIVSRMRRWVFPAPAAPVEADLPLDLGLRGTQHRIEMQHGLL